MNTTCTVAGAGLHVNGALLLGENVADNVGRLIAYKAYKPSLLQRGAPSAA